MNEKKHPKEPVALIDDETDWLNSFAFALEYQLGVNNIIKVHDSEKAIDTLDQQEFSLVILDINMPRINGPTILKEIKKKSPDIPVLMLTGMNDINLAIECFKLGAADYIVKTDDKEKIFGSIKKILDTVSLKQQKEEIERQLQESESRAWPEFDKIITKSSSMLALFRYLNAVSKTKEPVLITGESGTGKELFAEAVYKLWGKGQFVTVNVAGLDDTMFSDTLFGHVKGAFTSANTQRDGLVKKAQGGTLFLDEIGDLPQTSQVKLLRLIQNGSFFPLGGDKECFSDAKIVVATNKNLHQLVEKGEFREDLFYRLRTHHVHIPPLRDRREDIPLLMKHFLREFQQQVAARENYTIVDEAYKLLNHYSLQGNVRELRSMIIDVASNCEDHIIRVKDLISANGLKGSDRNGENGPCTPDKIIFPEPLPSIESTLEQLLFEAMERSSGKQSEAAKLLGITPQAVSKRLKKISSACQ